LSGLLSTYDAGKQNVSAQLFVLDKTHIRPPRPAADDEAMDSSAPPTTNDQSFRAG
jgi:hypothetical protein